MLQAVLVKSTDADDALDWVSPAIMSAIALGGRVGAHIRIGNCEPRELVAERGFGNIKPNRDLNFEDLSGLKYGLSMRLGVSTRHAITLTRSLMSEEKGLHPGAIIFGNCLISVAGLGDGNELMACLLAERLGVLYVPT